MMDSLKPHGLSDSKKESLFTALFVGSLFIILALVYYIHLSDDLGGSLVNFFMSLTLSPAMGVPLPAPSDPSAYMNLYVAAFQFTLALGVLEIAILALRVKLHSTVSRKAETIENIVFWLGTSYLVTSYLMNMTIITEWFVFWAGVILIFGLALLARAFVLLAKRN